MKKGPRAFGVAHDPLDYLLPVEQATPWESPATTTAGCFSLCWI